MRGRINIIIFSCVIFVFSINFIHAKTNNEINEEIDQLLDKYYSMNKFMGSVLVAKAGEVIFSKGYGYANIAHDVPNTSETVFRLGSLTKQFTAVAVLQLYERGLLDVKDPVSRYIPDYPNGEKITIHNLLNHTSGIPSFTDFDEFNDINKNDMEIDEIIELFSNRDLEFDPGEMFKYSNSGYLLLTKIIEVVSGQSYEEYLNKNIFIPLNMDNSGLDDYFTVVPNKAEGYIFWDGNYQYDEYVSMSIPLGAGGLYSSIEDLYIWDRALYGNEILRENAMDLMLSRSILLDSSDMSKYYGYGWFISEVDGKVKYSHSGGIEGFVSYIARYPDVDMTIIILSNNILSHMGNLQRSIFAIMTDKSYELPVEYVEIELDPTLFERYTGVYRLNPEMEFIVLINEEKIYLQGPDGKKVELFPKSEISFFIKEMDIVIDFVIENEIVSGLILNQMGNPHEMEKIE